MLTFEDFLQRNERFAEKHTNDLTIMPRSLTIILSCLDARTDPAQFLGIEAGDALVMRTAGARVGDDLALDLGILWRMVQRMQGEHFKGISFAIVQHTNCGFERLANPDMAAGLSRALSINVDKITKRAIYNHEQSMQNDITKLKNSPYVPNEMVVGGYLFDLDSGLVNEVIEKRPLSEHS
ncbi:MAG: carbonic anhydrase [Chloroflexota bacterium]